MDDEQKVITIASCEHCELKVTYYQFSHYTSMETFSCNSDESTQVIITKTDFRRG